MKIVSFDSIIDIFVTIGRETASSLRFVRFAIHGFTHCDILALRLSCLRAIIRRCENIPSPCLEEKIGFWTRIISDHLLVLDRISTIRYGRYEDESGRDGGLHR